MRNRLCSQPRNCEIAFAEIVASFQASEASHSVEMLQSLGWVEAIRNTFPDDEDTFLKKLHEQASLIPKVETVLVSWPFLFQLFSRSAFFVY